MHFCSFTNKPKREGKIMRKIVIISGSPLAPSRTDLVLRYVESLLQKKGFSVDYIAVPDLPPEDLVYARFNSPAIRNVIEQVGSADGIIIGSPVYKASYTGVLKALLDLLPENAFRDKPVLPFMVGGSIAHLLAIEFSLKPIIHNLKGVSTHGIYFEDTSIDKESSGNPIKETDCEFRLQTQLQELLNAIERTEDSKQLVASLVY